MSTPRICIVKTSSMGDVIHALPVVSDIRRALPDARVDWVVEESFADLPRLHAGVARVLPVALRRWRKSPFAARTRGEFRAFRAQAAAQGRYDLVLDLQGLYKSALIACAVPGPRAGFSLRCAREPLAALCYARRYDVDMKAHAIERLRQLAAQALGYRLDGLPQFGIDGVDDHEGATAPAVASTVAPNAATKVAPNVAPGVAPGVAPKVAPNVAPNVEQGRYVVLLHATSRAEKLWPNAHWRALIGRLAQQGYECVLPWGSEAERQQAQAIAQGLSSARVAPRMNLRQCAALLAGAQAVVGVDTGLTHLAAALDRPTISIFGATEAWRFGPYWSARALNLGGPGQWPDAGQVSGRLLELLAPEHAT